MNFAELNERLQRTTFLPEALEPSFREMCAECERLAVTDQPLRLPPSTTPKAFQTVFGIWEILNKRLRESRSREKSQ